MGWKMLIGIKLRAGLLCKGLGWAEALLKKTCTVGGWFLPIGMMVAVCLG
jgi:hypothetical protein